MPLIFVLCLFATPRTLWASEFVSPNAVGSIDAPNVEPLAVQIDEVKLKVFLQRAVETDTQVLIVEKNNKTVVEKYWKEPSFQYQIHSISKSLVSLAIGKLIDEDKLKLEDFASKWFSTWSGEKNNITLRHLLTHTSGLEDDSDTIEKSVNSLQASVDLPLKHSPGEKYFYSAAGVMLLGEIVKKISGLSVDAYLDQNFFKPLNITGWTWRKDRVGNVLAHSGAMMSARDLLKIGELALKKGQWKGTSLISEKYLEIATHSATTIKDNDGLLWRTFKDGFFAKGRYGQTMIVVPSQELIIVRLRAPKSNQNEPEAGLREWESITKDYKEFLKFNK